MMAARSGAAEENKFQSKNFTPRLILPSVNETGVIGLSSIPSARMDDMGTIRIGSGTSDPYIHAFMGLQLTKSFYVSLRQTAEISSLSEAARDVHPGVDVKLRLAEETDRTPAVVIGLDGAFGHKRMSSEYIALSKRYRNFDCTGGLAWGRLGSAGHINNPLKFIGDHFDKTRTYDALESSGVRNWFTGDQIGFFGGVEVATPLKGLTVQAEYGANDYAGTDMIDGFNPPEPWAVSLNYTPFSYASLKGGIVGGDKILARLSLQGQGAGWWGRPSSQIRPPTLKDTRRDHKYKGVYRKNLSLSSHMDTATQIGRTARVIANRATETQEQLPIRLSHKGLKGSKITLIRADLERAVLEGRMTPAEIWQDTTIQDNGLKFYALSQDKTPQRQRRAFPRLTLESQASLSQIDTEPLYRFSLLADKEAMLGYGFLVDAQARLNLANNLEDLNLIRLFGIETIRGDVADFAEERVGLDRLALNWLHSFDQDWHMGMQVGYLEEMFAGYGGEILYRPWQKNFGIGGEFWRVHKRNVDTELNHKIIPEGYNTGFLNLTYEVPNKDMTVFFKAGQFIQGDYGGTIGLKTRFDNGVMLEGFATQSSEGDYNLFGNVTDLHTGLRLSLPIGNTPVTPDGSQVRIKVEPFARGTGQVWDNPQDLYTLTEPVSYRQITRSWGSLLE